MTTQYGRLDKGTTLGYDNGVRIGMSDKPLCYIGKRASDVFIVNGVEVLSWLENLADQNSIEGV